MKSEIRNPEAAAPGGVAQIFNLPYRRIAFCVRPQPAGRRAGSTARPTASRRYGRLKICATLALVALGLSAGALAQTAGSSGNPASHGVLLFSFFRNNGEDGLHLATSTNGLQWTELAAPGGSFLEPKVGGKLMRDPCLRLGPDGTFHLVWTTSWGKPTVIGLAHSRDLVHWSEQQAVPVMEQEPAAQNAWAPELFYDDATGQWLIFWASTVPGRFLETTNAGDKTIGFISWPRRTSRITRPRNCFTTAGSM